MASHRFSASSLIKAPPLVVYDIIADYHHGHQQILPRPPFVAMDVEEGGKGAGTVIRAYMRIFGQIQSFRGVVTEPEPGRVLMETTDTGYVTTFIVEPRAKSKHAYVTIATEMTKRPGIVGALERWLIPRLLRPAYVKELRQLSQLAAVRTK